MNNQAEVFNTDDPGKMTIEEQEKCIRIRKIVKSNLIGLMGPGDTMQNIEAGMFSFDQAVKDRAQEILSNYLMSDYETEAASKIAFSEALDRMISPELML